jgi:hypothetical protein
MWRFGGKKIAARLGAIAAGEPAAVDVVASVVSPNVVTSPVTGTLAALLQVELLERDTLALESLGLALFGEILVLRDADGDELSVVARRARLELATPHTGGTPIDRIPAELVPFLRRSRGHGIVCYREFALREGDKIRVKAVVEASGATRRYVARDDLSAVVLEELFEPPGW